MPIFFDGVIIKDDGDIDLPTGQTVTSSAAPAPVNGKEATTETTGPHYSQMDLLGQAHPGTHDGDGNVSAPATLLVPETPDSPVGEAPERATAQHSQLNLLDRPLNAMQDQDRSNSDAASHTLETPNGRVGNEAVTTEPRYSQLNLIDL